MAMEFLVHGAVEYGEPGVFVAFEETQGDLETNFASIGFHLGELIAQGKLIVEYIHVDPSEIAVAGAYDLEGLFIRLQAAVESIDAKRVAIDTLETIFGGFTDQALLRAEIRRLFRWLKGRGLSGVITAERGESTLTRQGLEEFVSDCVLVLDHRMDAHISTRHLRILKYRGSTHGMNEYPFLIDENGLSVLPISSLNLDHQVSEERMSTGISRLDAMMEGKGFFRGSSILVSGTSGSGKTSLACSFVEAACARGERCLYLASEESPSQIERNMRSIGLDLARWKAAGLLHIHASRPTVFGLEMHLVRIHRMIHEIRPQVLVIDPLSNFASIGSTSDVNAMLMRLIDYLKSAGVTAMMTNLTRPDSSSLETTQAGVSSIIDTWLLLRDIESSGERNRAIYILKSRGMSHSNQIREFELTPHGIELVDVYVGPEGVLTGAARLAVESREEAEAIALSQDIENLERQLEYREQDMKSRAASTQAALQIESANLSREIAAMKEKRQRILRARREMATQRDADGGASASNDGGSEDKDGCHTDLSGQ
jgi:circadian clock protein KaiC